MNGVVGGWVGRFLVATYVHPLMTGRRIEPDGECKSVGDVPSFPLAPWDCENGVPSPERVDDFLAAWGDEGFRIIGALLQEDAFATTVARVVSHQNQLVRS